MSCSLNTNADVLSRSQCLDEPTEDDIKDFKQDLHDIKTVNEQHSIEDQYKYILLEKIGKLSMLNIPWTLMLNRNNIIPGLDNDLVLVIVKG